MIVHLIFCWSSFLSWLLFIIDLGLIALLTYKAYHDAEILDRSVTPVCRGSSSHLLTFNPYRFELPIFGRLANNFLDDE
jgi:uncharacterized membrane protein